MSEINTVQGKIEIKGTVHGAINTIVFLFASPQDWEFKQFISQEHRKILPDTLKKRVRLRRAYGEQIFSEKQ